MVDKKIKAPDNTAVRVALWRALHVQADAPPHILVDEVGLTIAAPDKNWRQRPDMHLEGTKLFRASIVARARFIEDLVAEKVEDGIGQYVILGAGLDTFAQRRPEFASRLKIFEVDAPGPQAWKRERLIELGWSVPECLKLVPVDFEAGESWLTKLKDTGFDASRPSIVASTGVAMYLTRETNQASLREIARFAAGSTLAMSYLIPKEHAEPEERPGLEMAEKGARAAGTPFLSFFTSQEICELALAAGFKTARTVAAADLARRYFAGRSDGFRLSKSEELLIATT